MRREQSELDFVNLCSLVPSWQKNRVFAPLRALREIIREFVANLSLLVLRPTMAKRNQSPLLGDLGGLSIHPF